MKTLTDNQKEFLLSYFFNPGEGFDEYPGWRRIALNLIECGHCIVAGTTCIWQGGIGNFIQTSPTPFAVDCLLYTFDINQLLSSKWFDEIKSFHLSEVNTTIENEEMQLAKLKIHKQEIILLTNGL